MRALFPMIVVLYAAAHAQTPRIEAGLQIGALDERGALGEKPAMAGGHVSVRAHRWFDAEAEINRFPIGGAASNFPGTEFLFGAKAGLRGGPFGVFAKARPGFIRYGQASPYLPSLGTRPVFDLGVVLAFYSAHHVFARTDFGDLVAWYGASGFGTRHQFRGTFGFGLWF